MAFENVNVTQLKNAINSCKSNLNYSTSKSLITSVSSNDVWQTDSRNKLKKSLETLTQKRYKELEKKLDSYLKVISNIEKYKNLEKENKTKQNEIDRLQGNLYKTEEYKVQSVDSQGATVETTKTRQVVDQNVQNKINKLKKEIKDNKSEMSSLLSKVQNGI